MSTQGCKPARLRAARRRRLGSGRRLQGAGLLACVTLLALPGAAPARTLEHKLSTGTGLPEYAGFAVDIEGDTAVVGAPIANGNRGAVYVFSRAGGDWTKVATLTPADPQAGEYLGFSVAIEGDTIVAGAPGGPDGSGEQAEGRVYTFTRTGAADRHETATLTASDAGTDGLALGWSVGIDGDTIVAGAPGYLFLGGGILRPGAVYTFTRTGAAARTETAKLTLAGGSPTDLLGWSVAIDGDTIVAGAPNVILGQSATQGAVYTFARTGAAARHETATLTVAGGGTNDAFGLSVAIDGDVIVAGAPATITEIGGVQQQMGAVYTFTSTGATTRNQTAKLTPSTADPGLYVGIAVDIDGDDIVAGGFSVDFVQQGLRGAAFVFTRTGAPVRTETERLLMPEGAASTLFLIYGNPLAVSGGTIIAGAPATDGGQGAAFVSGPETTITAGPADGSFTSDTTPEFAFEADVTNPSFACRVDTGAWAACTSPREIGPLGDGEHTFEVVATDQNGDVDPSPAERTFTVDTVPPETTITAGPAHGSFTNNPTPTFEFSSDEEGTFECQVDTPVWTACTSPLTTASLVDGEHTFRVRAIDRAGNIDPLPAKRTFMVDTIPPDTTITAGPAEGALINTASPTFAFSSDEEGTFECQVDTGAWAACTSPSVRGPLSDSTHTFRVRAIDLATNVDPSPAERTFTVDTVPPETTITAGPAHGSFTNDPMPTFEFSSDEEGTFECQVDTPVWTACTSPLTTASLVDGEHTFRVRAIDRAGNVDPLPAKRTFMVDTIPPDTTITAGPANDSFTNDTTPEFAFSANEEGTFECQVDTGDWAACSSPSSRGPLNEGEHTFRVRAIDQATNVDPSPAERTFTVDTTPPQTTITSGPAEGSFTPNASPSFAFDANEPGTFECQVDEGAWWGCSSPLTIGPLSHGPHTFRVRAIDRATNVDPTPASRTFVVNRPPVAAADAYSVIGGGTLTVPAPGVLANDSDPDGDPLTAQVVSPPPGGGLTLNGDGSLTYTAGEDADGPVTFTYHAFDGYEYSGTVTVTITVFAGCDGVRATIKGTTGNNEIDGTGGNDVIAGLGGNDTITPGSGNDRACGGAGNDAIDDGSGSDYASGGSGNDALSTGSGDDTLYGGAGDDRLDGGGDRDRLFGEAGIDRLFGGGDPDVLNGGADTPDSCDGEGGSDSTTGGCETLTSVP
jgi:Ca2+-binding RTX toxin-like protein